MKGSLQLFNSLSKKKEHFFCQDPSKKVTLYTCGPTIYNFAHIGNFRTYIFEDILRRTLAWFGYDVEQAMNLTDVDDKTIHGAVAQKISLSAFTEPYKIAFFEDLACLNIQKAEHYPEATAYFPQMIEIISDLLEKKIAYVGQDQSVYFRIQKFPQYGKLTHCCMDDLKVGASGNVRDEYDKESIADFVLWKAYDPSRDGTIFWESPFGPGRPGWHIECSAMSLALLGKERPIDIHCGGEDNRFPHHENEIAQSEAHTGNTFVRFWLHSAHLLVDGKKMSKSLGNFYTLRDLLERGYTGLEVRFALLQTHYRSPYNFTFEGLDAARNGLQRLVDFYLRMQELAISDKEGKKNAYDEKPFLEAFGAAIGDDLNLSEALGVLFEEVRLVYKRMDEGDLCSKDAEKILSALQSVDSVLGCIHLASEQEVPQEVLDAAGRRFEARKNKNWKEADTARDFVLERGWMIEDTPNGFRVKKKGVS